MCVLSIIFRVWVWVWVVQRTRWEQAGAGLRSGGGLSNTIHPCEQQCHSVPQQCQTSAYSTRLPLEEIFLSPWWQSWLSWRQEREAGKREWELVCCSWQVSHLEEQSLHKGLKRAVWVAKRIQRVGNSSRANRSIIHAVTQNHLAKQGKALL